MQYTALQLDQVFAKARQIPFRPGCAIDDSGREIHRSEHGNVNSPYGWQVDHFPIAKCNGGPDEIWNLRPLHCGVNASLGGLLGAERNAFRDAARRPEGLLSRLLKG